MSRLTLLVVGATGALGEPVARQLLRDGYDVRLFVRDLSRAEARFGADFEYVVGDVGDGPSIERALQGCYGVHVSLQAASAETIEQVEHLGTARIADAAARQGVARLTYLSGYLATREHLHIPQHRAKYLAEQAIQQSGVPYTLFKPTYFMDTLPRHIQGTRAVAIGHSMPPLHMIAAEDYARMVSAAFRKPEAANRSFFIRGTEAITIADALRLYCEIVEPGKRVVVLPIWLMSLIDRLFLRGQLRGTLDIMALMERVGEPSGAADTFDILGRPTMTVRKWCEKAQQRRLQGASS